MRGKGWSVIKERPYLNPVESGTKRRIGLVSYVAVIVTNFPNELLHLPLVGAYPDTTGRPQGLVV